MDKNEQIYEVIEKAIESQTAFGDLLTPDEKQTLIDRGTVHSAEIGRAHVWTPVTLIYLVCRLLLEKKKKKN